MTCACVDVEGVAYTVALTSAPAAAAARACGCGVTAGWALRGGADATSMSRARGEWATGGFASAKLGAARVTGEAAAVGVVVGATTVAGGAATCAGAVAAGAGGGAALAINGGCFAEATHR